MKTEQNAFMRIAFESFSIDAVLDRGFSGEGNCTSDIHTHASYELIIQTQGFFTVKLADGTSLPMDEGAVCLIPPGQYHSVSQGTQDAQKLAIRFRYTRAVKGKAASILHSQFHSALQKCRQAQRLENQQQIRQTVLELRQEMSSQRWAGELYQQTLLTQVFALLIRSLNADKKAQTQDPLPAEHETRWLVIEEYMNANYTRQITQEDLAEHMHLSKRQLSRILRTAFATSFRQLLIEFRMNNAAELLHGTQLTPEEIAYAVGYTSVSGFYDAFRKVYGVSVGKFRKQL